jgi:hypothetical protein
MKMAALVMRSDSLVEQCPSILGEQALTTSRAREASRWQGRPHPRRAHGGAIGPRWRCILQFRTADQQRRSLCVGEAKQLDIATQWETVILDQRAVHPPSTTRE